METTIESPTTELVDRAEINDGQVLVQYTKTEAALAQLRQKYQGATFDLTTTKGDKEARAARLELVTLRGLLEKGRKELKKPALEFGQKIDAEAARITAEIKALESPIDQQIVADEARRAAEKAERERVEAARIASHQNRLTAIRSCATRAQGLPSARIANGIAQVEMVGVDAELWEEFADEAVTAKVETLAAMRAMFDAAKAREDEQARVEAQRLENERIAAENRAAAERLAEQQRALDAQAAALKAEREAKAEADRPREYTLATAPPCHQTIVDDAGAADIYSAAIGDTIICGTGIVRVSSDSTIRIDPRSVTEDDDRRVTLTQLNALLAPVGISGAGLSELGFEPVERIKNSCLYRRCDVPAICAAIREHLLSVAVAVAERVTA